MDRSEENRLISDVLNGEAEAFAILVNRYQRPIFNLMLRMSGSREDATDLTQDAFLKAYEHLEKFRPSRRFFPWLYTIGMNLAVDHLRKQKNPTASLDGQNPATAAEVATDDDTERLIFQLDADRLPTLLTRLPVDYREALILRFHEGLTMKDVGAALGITTSGAKMRVKRGLQQLRDMLGITGKQMMD